jgi:sulfide dehydrogenase [flavocytochrome c] flavoprotein subunit
MTKLTRRHFLTLAGGIASAGLGGFPLRALSSGKQVVVIGGGVGGTIAAQQLRKADPSIAVTLIEQNKHYHAAFMSNELLSGVRTADSLRFSYDGLRKSGITVIPDRVVAIDPASQSVSTRGGQTIRYDRLVLAPGISLKWNAIDGYSREAAARMPHAWQDGEQVLVLRKQLETMKKGGVVVITVPDSLFCCPSAPYERASLIAYFLKQHNPTSKLLIVDAHDHFHLQELFLSGWQERYPGMIEWIKGSETSGGVVRVDAAAMKVYTGGDTFQADVANVIPPQQAGDIANAAGVSDSDGWCSIDPATFESRRQKGIHIIGDACNALEMPKSAQTTHAQAKACAHAIVALLNGRQPVHTPLVYVDYSLIAPDYGIASVGIYRLAEDKTRFARISGGQSKSGSSADHRNRQVQYAHSWFNNITYDMFG